MRARLSPIRLGSVGALCGACCITEPTRLWRTACNVGTSADGNGGPERALRRNVAAASAASATSATNPADKTSETSESERGLAWFAS